MMEYYIVTKNNYQEPIVAGYDNNDIISRYKILKAYRAL